MKISDRLYMSAAMISKCNVVADIGCDHGYSSIYLIRHGITNRAIAMDLRKGPLERAKANIKLYGCSDMIETRLSNGISMLQPHEADTILIAGMGGKLMTDILKAKPEVVQSVEQLVLQPQSDVGDVRRYLYTIGFCIVEENMCIEEDKYYVAMRAVPQKKAADISKLLNYTDVEYEFGRILLEQKHKVLISYIEEEYRKSKLVLAQLESSDTPNARKRLPSYREIYNVLEKAREMVNNK